MVDALLLELEGVVVETEPLWRDALSAALREHELSVPSDVIDAGRGMPLHARVERLVRDERLTIDTTGADLIAFGASRRFADALRRGITLVPGARELLESARQSARVAVVTRARRSDADVMLTLSGLDALVEFVIAAEDAPAKPAAAPYERALSRLNRRGNVRRDAVLALEDGEPGAQAARAAGLRCIVVEDDLPARDLASLDELRDRRTEHVG